MKLRLISLLILMLAIQACRVPGEVTPSPEPPAPGMPTPTSKTLDVATPILEPPTAVPSTPTAEFPPPSPATALEPPPGFKPYQDEVAGVSIFVLESWIATQVDPGRFAILQSYPEDKYIGGEPFQPGDTKCDLNIRPPGTSAAGLVEQWKSDPETVIISEQEIVLDSGQPATRLEAESLGRAVSLITEINERAVSLTCFGEFGPFDGIASTLNTLGTPEGTPPPAMDPSGFKAYQDSVAGLSVRIPGSWTVTGVVPGQRAILQSYPEGKYVGGEALQPGDTKCDLFLQAPGTGAMEFVAEMKSNLAVTVLSEAEIVLQSGQPGTRLEVENMGRSTMLVTEIQERVVVLSCFGEPDLFDAIAFTLRAVE